jgi:hypothetical protein
MFSRNSFSIQFVALPLVGASIAQLAAYLSNIQGESDLGISWHGTLILTGFALGFIIAAYLHFHPQQAHEVSRTD